ncbi:MAG: type III-B CRISPR module-associated Cmr3 family protein [Leptolyngbyaceae bacterium]|nr:type III-B CRISPR module-associated Cmr3 family protein [Leptolyngbyaceae bacterium]
MTKTIQTPPFRYVISLEPLGLLYGSAGRFLSPDNLVGRSGTHFPPSSTTLSGLFAAYYHDPIPDHTKHKEEFQQLQLAGPFWGWSDRPQDFCVPTPMNCLVKMGSAPDDGGVKDDEHDEDNQNNGIQTGYVSDRLQYHPDATSNHPAINGIHWRNLAHQPPEDKFARGTWVKISDWQRLSTTSKDALNHRETTITTYTDPWSNIPHLHPYIKADERRVDTDRERGSLFLENGVQMHPDTCLVYLSNLPVASGWYRFGGEGHMVDLQCHALQQSHQELLNQPLGKTFALITSAIWGSNRLSYREPRSLEKGKPQRHELPQVDQDLTLEWETQTILTERPTPSRYRLGHRKDNDGKTIHEDHQPKLLSRGRYAVLPGTVYVTTDNIPCWHDWPENWFPQEGPSLKRWGSGLALPLSGVMVPDGSPEVEREKAIAE